MTTTSKKGSFLKGNFELNVFGKKIIISRKTFFYTGFFIALAIGFYFILIAFNPEISKKTFPPVSYVRPFSFTNQDGKQVTDRDVAGKVYVAEYFFTT